MNRRISTLIGLFGFNLIFFGILLSWILAKFSPVSLGTIFAGAVMVVVWATARLADIKTSIGRHRISMASSSVVGIGFLGGILIIANIIAGNLELRIDTTAEKLHTLSESTISVLRNLPEPVKLILFDNPESPADETVVDLLKEYDRASKKVSLRIIDPDRNPKLARQYGINQFGQVAVICGDKSLTLSDPDEEKLTNTIKQLAFGGGKKLYFLTGHGEPSPYSDKVSRVKLFAQAVRYEGLEFDTLNLMATGKIPDDAGVVAVISPRRELFPGERDSLLAYFLRGGKLFITVDPICPDSFAGWLGNFGVRTLRAMIFDNSPQNRSFGLAPEMPLGLSYSADHPITADFSLPTMFPTLRPLTRRDTAYARVRVLELAKTSQTSWADFDWQTENPKFAPDTDLKGPLDICFAVDIPDRKNSPRAVICGDGDFLTNDYIGFAGNRDFALNIINWLTEQEKLISIRPKKPKLRPIYLSSQQESEIFYICVVGIPFVLLFVAQILWWKRQG